MNKLQKATEKVLDIIYPNSMKCIFCGRDILNFDVRPFCDDCCKAGYFNEGNRCHRCDMHIPNGNTTCDNCHSQKRYYERAFCPLVYKDGVKNAILKLKSDNAKYLARPFAKLIYDRLVSENLSFDLIIPVPIHQKTRKTRGYNQSELIAEELAKLLNIPLLTNVVVKETQTNDQKLLPYHDRFQNVATCFKLKDKKAVKNKSVLILDDVMTTGATLNAISKLILPYTKHVYVCAVARDEPQPKTKMQELKRKLRLSYKKFKYKIFHPRKSQAEK